VARRQTRRAEHVRDFLIDLFRQADPSHTRGTTITAREILEAGARQVAHDLGGDPPVEAELLDTIAQVEGSLALPAARAHAEQALAISRRSLGEDDPGTTASRLTQAEVLLEQGDLETVRRELDGHGFRKAFERMFGHAIDRSPGSAHMTHLRSDVDNRSASFPPVGCLQHFADGRLGNNKSTAHVERELFLEVSLRDLNESFGNIHPRIIHEHIQSL